MKQEPIDVLLKPFNRFIRSETTSGIVLFLSAIVALVWANSPFAHSYHELWEKEFGFTFAGETVANTLHHWINDGLMAMFFFVVGLELKREIMEGELSSPRQALLPLIAAVGGMIFPAAIFLIFNPDAPEQAGWGVPMATDIAFALGVLAVLGKRVPVSLKIFLTALAIADDLGAVLVIAFFYTTDISIVNLASGGIFLGMLVGANLMGIRSSLFYGILGIGGLWLAFLLSGVHATIAGVLAAICIPARTKIDEDRFIAKLKEAVNEFLLIPKKNKSLLEPDQVHAIEKIKTLTLAADTPLQRLEHSMHPLVAFVVMPLFALANAGIEISGSFVESITHPVSLGIAAGLVVGKFVGIGLGCFVLVKMGWATLPAQVRWPQLLGAALLGGIGFTMSLFITNLAYTDQQLVLWAKTGILGGSLFAMIAGIALLWLSSSNSTMRNES